MRSENEASAERFGDDDRRILAEILDRLVPSDDLGPGAADVDAIAYIESAVHSERSQHATLYRAGLAQIDERATAIHGRRFTELEDSEQKSLLCAVDDEIQTPPSTLKLFFELVLAHTHEAMFGNPEYGEAASHAGWRLIDYPGPQPAWPARAQDLTPLPIRTPDSKGDS